MALCDNIRVPNPRMEDIANDIESLIVTGYQIAIAPEGTETTGSEDLVAVTDAEVSIPVATGQVVHITGQVQISHDTQYEQVMFQLFRDDQDLLSFEPTWTVIRDGTFDVPDGLLSFSVADYPDAGTYNYSLWWHTTDGTAYLWACEFTIVVMRYGAAS